jgi:hypothetical protein
MQRQKERQSQNGIAVAFMQPWVQALEKITNARGWRGKTKIM